MQSPDENGKWDFKTAYEKCQTVIGEYPETFGSRQCLGLISQITNKELNYVTESVNVPDKPFLSLLTYKNIPKAHFRIVKVSEKEEKKILDYPYEKRAEYLQKLDPLSIWSVDLPLNQQKYLY